MKNINLNLFIVQVFVTVFLALSIGLQVAMIVIGIIYKNQCAYQRNIPVWLIVGGVFGILSALLRTISTYLGQRQR